MTVLEIIKRSTEFLARQQVESPRLQSELLLAYVLGVARLNLYLDFERKLTELEIGQARELVKRRGTGEPLQHILGTTSFCGLEIKVSSAVLVPRPETELLAERAWKELQPNPTASQVLDFGTGSGCLAIAIAEKFPQIKVTALDISKRALEVARANIGFHTLGEKISLVHGSGFEALTNTVGFDLIISNPPYIPTAEIQQLSREVRNFDPHLALDGGVDGLRFYRMFAEQAKVFLHESGSLLLEFGDGQEAALVPLFESAGWIVETQRDYAGKPRILIARRAKP